MCEANEFPRLSIISLGCIYYSINEFPRLSIISLDCNFHTIFIVCMAIQQLATYRSIIENARKFANTKYVKN